MQGTKKNQTECLKKYAKLGKLGVVVRYHFGGGALEHLKDSKKMKIGQILLKEGVVTKEQLDEALLFQEREPMHLPLGEICVNLQLISRDLLQKLLRKYKANIHIGELLLNMGLISAEQLEEALHHQSVMGGKLGKTLMDLGYLTEAALIEAVSIQLGYPKILPNITLIDRSLLDGVSAPFLKKNKFLPVFRENGTMTVVTSDPLNEQMLDMLKKHFRCDIELAVATSQDIIKAIDMYFRNVEPDTKLQNKDLVVEDIAVSGKGDDNIVEVVNFVISNAVLEEASDIHIEQEQSKIRVRYRIDGVLHHKTDLPKSMSATLVSRIKVLCKLNIAERNRHQDGRIEARVHGKEVDLRVATYASIWGESVVIRILPRETGLTDLNMLGFSPYHLSILKNILDMPAGIILITGPTGSGKTTTLYSAIYYLRESNLKIITAEDPVEYSIEGVTQGQMEKRLNHTYEDFLKAILRHDPDVIMIGEIRDRKTAEAVVGAALTGHKVMTTFHTEDTTGALLRLLDMGIETFLISSTVVSVISQRLVRTLCPRCKQVYEPDVAMLSNFASTKFTNLGDLKFYQPKGCHFCRYTGYKGRTGIHELLKVNEAIRDTILRRSTSHEIRKASRTGGSLVSMREDGLYKALMGITSLDEVVKVSARNEVDELAPRDVNRLIMLCESQIL